MFLAIIVVVVVVVVIIEFFSFLLLSSTERLDTVTYIPLVDDAGKELLSEYNTPHASKTMRTSLLLLLSSPVARLEQLSHGKNVSKKLKKQALSHAKSLQQQSRHGATTPIGKASKKKA